MLPYDPANRLAFFAPNSIWCFSPFIILLKLLPFVTFCCPFNIVFLVPYSVVPPLTLLCILSYDKTRDWVLSYCIETVQFMSFLWCVSHRRLHTDRTWDNVNIDMAGNKTQENGEDTRTNDWNTEGYLRLLRAHQTILYTTFGHKITAYASLHSDTGAAPATAKNVGEQTKVNCSPRSYS